MTAFALPTWRALSYFFCRLQGERDCNKSQKIWPGSLAALPFSLKRKNISQILEGKTKILSQIVTEMGIATFMLVKRLADPPALCGVCATPAELPISRTSQDRQRGRSWPEGGNAPPAQLEQLVSVFQRPDVPWQTYIKAKQRAINSYVHSLAS